MHPDKGKLLQPQKRKILQLVLISAAAVLGVSCRRNEPSDIAPGARFPDLQLPRLDGQPMFISPETALIVNFWATWCGPCRQEMSSLEKLGSLFSAKDLMVIAITVDADRNLAREFVLQHKLTMLMLSDSEQELSSNVLRIPAYPATYMLKRDRTIARIIVGARDWADPKMVGEIEGALDVQRIEVHG